RRTAIERLASIARRLDMPLSGLALAWVLGQPGVSIVLAGARAPEQVEQNLTGTRALTPGTFTEVDRSVAEPFPPPRPTADPWWPAIRERHTLLLHDYLGQLSEPLDERSIQRARALAELYRSPWVAEHFQCLHTEDGSYNLNYVFPPLYTEQFLERFIRNACALQARLDQPLVMENIPGFFDVKASQMPEPTWLRRFFEATGTGFLL